jgi:YidC/Oxa1 family membrane protein insertase
LGRWDYLFSTPFMSNTMFHCNGNHISLFPILASIAIFFYMKWQPRSTNGRSYSEGRIYKMMKIMIYVSPLMMLFFFNSYVSGLSLYYFISNTLQLELCLSLKLYYRQWFINSRE